MRESYGELKCYLFDTHTKKLKLQSFDEFKPISFCNMIYKIIAKVLALRLKPVLSEIINEEKFGFLNNR